MQTRTLLTTFAVTAVATAGLAQDEQLKSTDHKKVGKEVADYWTAKEETKDIAKTFQKLAETVDKIDERFKKDGSSVYASVADWEAIFWTATEVSLEDKSLKKGKVTEEASPVTTFTYWVDRRYKSTSGPFPIVIVVPDVGETPAAVATELSATPLGAEALVAVVHMDQLPGESSEKDWSTDEAAFQVLKTYSAVAKSNMFGLDCNRVLAVGRGKGFAAAAAAARRYPHFFAGLAGWGEIPNADATNFANLPSFVTGGGESAAFSKHVSELGYGNCTVGEETTDALWAWIRGTKRLSYPHEITFAPVSATARGTYWLLVDGVDLPGSPRVHAQADPEKNEILITAKGISTVQLMLNDELVNLAKPVKVTLNGISHEELLPRNPRWMIDQAYNAGDWGRVFCATASFEVIESE